MSTLLKNLLIIPGLLIFFSCQEELHEPKGQSNATNDQALALDNPGDTTAKPTNARLGYQDNVPLGNNNWGPGPYSVAGDFNGDGLEDIASPDGSLVFMKFSEGLVNSQISFTTRTWLAQNGWGDDDFTFSGDFNGDGVDDIASAQGTVVYMKFGSINGFIPYNWSVEGGWGRASYTIAGDFNGDGKTDIASCDGKKVYMKLSLTGGGFLEPSGWSTNGNFGKGGYTFAGDYNNDGLDDIISVDGTTVLVKVSEGNDFDNKSYTTKTGWGSESYTWVGDTDGNGRDEIITRVGTKIYIREWDFGEEFVRREAYSFEPWGSSGYNWTLDVDGLAFNGDELVSGIGNSLYVH